jgi:hypothetical protein
MMQKISAISVGGMSIGAAGGALLGIAKGELETTRERQDTALDINMSAAAADSQVVKNLVGETLAVKQNLLRELDTIAKSAGIESSVPVKLAFSAAISKASGNIGLATSATAAASKLNVNTPEDVATYAAGAVTLSTLAKTQDPREALGFAAGVQGRSPVVDPKEMFAELPGAIAATIATDVRTTTADEKDDREAVREAGALFAALGQATQQRAAPTATAEIQLANQLREFFRDRQDDPGTLRGRIETVQKSQELQQQIIPGLTGEAKFKAAFEQLLQGGETTVVQEFKKNLEGPGALQLNIDEFTIQVRDLSQSSRALAIAASEMSARSRAESVSLADTQGAIAASSRKATDDILKATGEGFLQQKKSAVISGVAETLMGEQGGAAAQVMRLKQMEESIRTDSRNPLINMAQKGFMGNAMFMPEQFQLSRLMNRRRTDEELTPDESARIQAIQETRRSVITNIVQMRTNAADGMTAPPVSMRDAMPGNAPAGVPEATEKMEDKVPGKLDVQTQLLREIRDNLKPATAAASAATNRANPRATPIFGEDQHQQLAEAFADN